MAFFGREFATLLRVGAVFWASAAASIVPAAAWVAAVSVVPPSRSSPRLKRVDLTMSLCCSRIVGEITLESSTFQPHRPIKGVSVVD